MSIIVRPRATRVGTLENDLQGSGCMQAGPHRGLPEIGATRARAPPFGIRYRRFCASLTAAAAP